MPGPVVVNPSRHWSPATLPTRGSRRRPSTTGSLQLVACKQSRPAASCAGVGGLVAIRQAPNKAAISVSGIAATNRGGVIEELPNKSHNAPLGVFTSAAVPASPTPSATMPSALKVAISVGVGSMGYAHVSSAGQSQLELRSSVRTSSGSTAAEDSPRSATTPRTTKRHNKDANTVLPLNPGVWPVQRGGVAMSRLLRLRQLDTCHAILAIKVAHGEP